MSLLDDLLRLLGTSRTKLRWRWRSRKEARARQARAEDNLKRSFSYGNKVCPKCRHPAGREEKVCSRCGTRLGSLLGQKLERWLGDLVPAGIPIVTIVLLAACVMIYVVGQRVSAEVADKATGLSGGQAQNLAYWQLGANVPILTLADGEYWRTVTYALIHVGGLLHLGMNALAIYPAGKLLEERFGRARVIVCYVISGITGGIVSAYWHRHQGALYVTSGGASGIAFGQIGMLVAHAAMVRDTWARTIRSRLMPLIIGNVIISFIPMVDGSAHLGGAIGGLLCGLVMSDIHVARRRGDWLWRILALGCVALTVLSWVWAAQHPFDLDRIL
jgi:membrane associated rhomboid family serine protease